jgi:hypothetical protein
MCFVSFREIKTGLVGFSPSCQLSQLFNYLNNFNMLLSNSKSFFSSVPYVGSILLIAWLLTNNNFFAYLSIIPTILLFLSTAIYLVILIWKYGSIIEVEAEINFITFLSYTLYTLLIMLCLFVHILFRGDL